MKFFDRLRRIGEPPSRIGQVWTNDYNGDILIIIGAPERADRRGDPPHVLDLVFRTFTRSYWCHQAIFILNDFGGEYAHMNETWFNHPNSDGRPHVLRRIS